MTYLEIEININIKHSKFKFTKKSVDIFKLK